MALLDLQNFSCGYGEIVAASGLSFTVESGQILALLGPNGAGKTSTILAVMGHVQIKAGTLSVDGRDITRLPALKRAELGLALVPEGRRLFSDLTVAENLTVGGYSRSRADEKRSLARVFDLWEYYGGTEGNGLTCATRPNGWRGADFRSGLHIWRAMGRKTQRPWVAHQR
jgi:branched-chain amino acid transport system ATP-binding protein